jgi:ATP-dependent DNA helicase RecG
VLRLFEKQKEIIRSDVETALEGSTTYAINTLKEMQEKEFIKRIGSGRLTRYRRFYETDL